MTKSTTAAPTDTTAPALWQQLADALNALEDAGHPVTFGDHKGPETDWCSAPYASSPRFAYSPSASWDLERRRWVVTTR